MSVTEESLALTEALRQSQVQVRAGVMADVAGLVAMLDFDDITRSWPALEAELIATTQFRRRQSETTAQMFYRMIREAEGVPGVPTVRAADPLDVAQLVRNLRVVGAGTAGQGVAEGWTTVRQTTASRIEGEITRNAENGGRFSTINSANADKECIGWLRITDGNPCAFCRMLASRGPVYKSRESALATRSKFSKARGKPDGRSRGKPGSPAPAIWSDRAKDFRAHPHCACTARAIYSTSDRLLRQSEEFYKEYNDAYDRYPDKDPLNAYRAYLRDRERAASLVRV
jgi:hypothetical protein